MKCAIALFLALALIGYAAAAVNVPWQQGPLASVQDYGLGEEMDYNLGIDEPGQEQDYQSDQGLMQQFIQGEIGEPTFFKWHMQNSCTYLILNLHSRSSFDTHERTAKQNVLRLSRSSRHTLEERAGRSTERFYVCETQLHGL